MAESVAWVALAFSLLALAFSLRSWRTPPEQAPDAGPDASELGLPGNVVTYSVEAPAGTVSGEPAGPVQADATMTPLPVYFGRYGATRARLHALAMVHPKDEEAG
jgi:hypothetical protein